MAIPVPATPQFHHEEGRARFERQRVELRGACDEASAERLLELATVLDCGVARLKKELLATSLCWNDDNRSLMDWIEAQHRGIGEAANGFAQAHAQGPRSLLHRLIACALHHAGEGIKWGAGRENSHFEFLHRLLWLATVRGLDQEALICRFDGGGKKTCVEALYVRTLLLERMGSGSLARPQLEVLDAWLWEWSAALRLQGVCPAGASLKVDLESNVGFTDAEASGATLRYLPLAALESRRRALIKSMHRGCLVPQRGCASELRLEEHIAVLDHLARAFRGEVAPERSARVHQGAPRVEVWVGLQEILARGIRVGVETGRFPTLNLEGAPAPTAAAAGLTESVRRYFWLGDASAGGLGFQALDSDAGDIEVGDLLGWRRRPGGPVELGRIVRRVARAGGDVTIGVRRLSASAQPLELLSSGPDAKPESRTHLFIPGEDRAGRQDTFLIPESHYDPRASYCVPVSGRDYRLRFNRVRERGRGWMLAGFEIFDCKGVLSLPLVPETEEPVQPPAAEGRIALEIVQEEHDPFSHEVRAKLLD